MKRKEHKDVDHFSSLFSLKITYFRGKRGLWKVIFSFFSTEMTKLTQGKFFECVHWHLWGCGSMDSMRRPNSSSAGHPSPGGAQSVSSAPALFVSCFINHVWEIQLSVRAWTTCTCVRWQVLTRVQWRWTDATDVMRKCSEGWFPWSIPGGVVSGLEEASGIVNRETQPHGDFDHVLNCSSPPICSLSVLTSHRPTDHTGTALFCHIPKGLSRNYLC